LYDKAVFILTLIEVETVGSSGKTCKTFSTRNLFRTR